MQTRHSSKKVSECIINENYLFNKLFLTKNEFEAYNKAMKVDPSALNQFNEYRKSEDLQDIRGDGSESKEIISMSTPYRPSSRPSSLLISEIESANNL